MINETIPTVSIPTIIEKPEPDFKFLVLVAMFSSLLIAMNLLGGKIVTVFGIAASVGVFIVPVTFAITDITTELYGRAFSRKLTFAGMLSILAVMVYSVIFVILDPNIRFASNDAYATVFGTSLRIMTASIVAFTLAQLQDIFIFDKVRKMTKGRWLWVRTNVSTFFSELVDTTGFMFIAFYMITPKFDALFVIKMIIPYLFLKIAFALLITPAVYAGVRGLRKREV